MRLDGVESLCVFGSAARSSTDLVSDRDVLVVADDGRWRQRAVRRLREAGWSVASYSPKRLLKMAAAGSLFVQHLKLEGIIIEDRNGWLARLLRTADRKDSYEGEALGSVALAQPIERFPARASIRQMPIVADLGYVALRNFGICYLAGRNRIVFDFHRIVDGIADDFGLSEEERSMAHSLRIAKAAYRAGCRGTHICGTVDELRHLLSKFFQHCPLKEICRNAPVRELGSGYATLRDFEAAVVRRVDESQGIWNPQLAECGQLWKMIENPRTYAWDVRNVSVGELESIRCKVAKLVEVKDVRGKPRVGYSAQRASGFFGVGVDGAGRGSSRTPFMLGVSNR